MENEMSLKDLVFSRAEAEFEAFRQMQGDGYTRREKEVQHQRFYTAYQIIEEAGLENEYRFWCGANA